MEACGYLNNPLKVVQEAEWITAAIAFSNGEEFVFMFGHTGFFLLEKTASEKFCVGRDD